MEIPISVTAYNGTPVYVSAYNEKSYMRYCVQWKFENMLLRTMEIFVKGRLCRSDSEKLVFQ